MRSREHVAKRISNYQHSLRRALTEAQQPDGTYALLPQKIERMQKIEREIDRLIAVLQDMDRLNDIELSLDARIRQTRLDFG